MRPEQSSFNIEGIQVNAPLIQQAFQNAKVKDMTTEMLTNTFTVLQLIKQNEAIPNAHNQTIKAIVESGMLPDPNEIPQKQSLPDFSMKYPLMKGGSFGVLERECQVTKKGFFEREEKKEAKEKVVTGFINKIEHYMDKDKQKIDWIKQSKEFPFRIILHGEKKQPKAVFFRTKNEAQSIRIHYINKFNQMNVSKMLSKAKQIYVEQVLQSVKHKMNAYRLNRKNMLQIKGRSNKSDDVQVNGAERRGTNDLPSLQNGQIPVNQTHIQEPELQDKQQRENSTPLNMQSPDSRKSQSQFGRSNRSFNNRFSKLEDSDRSSKLIPRNGFPTIGFCSIEFLTLRTAILKPVVSISVTRDQNSEYKAVFETVIQSKDPHLAYRLVLDSGEECYTLQSSIENYEIYVEVIDRLTNTELCRELIPLRTKVFSKSTLLLNPARTIGIQVRYDDPRDVLSELSHEETAQSKRLIVATLSQQNVEKIKKHWAEESIARGLHNANREIKIIEILELCEVVPPYWALNLTEEEYRVMKLLSTAAKILGFKMLRSILAISRSIQYLYSQMQELIEATLSIITNYMRTYYYGSQICRLHHLHSLLGIDGQIEFPSKVWVEMAVVNRIIGIEAPQCAKKMARRNITLTHLLYHYIYELYSRVFPIKTLVGLWNFCFKDLSLIHVYLILIGVWLVMFYSHKLVKCRRLKEIREVLESQQVCSSEIIIKEILTLKQKYLSPPVNSAPRGLDNNPLSQVLIEFYTRETARMDRRRDHREVEKEAILHKLNSQIPLTLPNYPQRNYCFHIFLYNLPDVPGSLYIRANGIEYECLGFLNQRYFIIGSVGTQVQLEFIDNKSNEFVGKLVLTQGVNKESVSLKSERGNTCFKVQYISGLLTSAQIQVLKKNRKFSHYIASYTTKQQLLDELLRVVGDSLFLRDHTDRLSREDLGKKVKVIFSSGSKNFDEIDFYLRWIAHSQISLPQKIHLVRQYANNVSMQYFLSHNRQLERIFLQDFLAMIDFPLANYEFESYYADSVENEFKAAKMLRCRLILPNGHEYKLEELAIQYCSQRSETGFYGDILLPELLEKIGSQLERESGSISEAMLELLYCSSGAIHQQIIPVVRRKNSKQLVVDREKYQMDNPQTMRLRCEPEVLASEILPTFSMINVLREQITSSSPHSRESAQKVNLLRSCDAKLDEVICLRFDSYPDNLDFPFLEYYHELMCDAKPPSLPSKIFIDEAVADWKSICVHHGALCFSDSKRMEPIKLNPNLGLHGNFRSLSSNKQSLYFSTDVPGQTSGENGLVFVNYGFGMYQWEPCIVLGFLYLGNNSEQPLSLAEKQQKKRYQVSYQGVINLYKPYQIEISAAVEASLPQISNSQSNQ